jgi:hypothetical protein
MLLFTIWSMTGFEAAYLAIKVDWTKQQTQLIIYADSIYKGVDYLCFNLSHAILAWVYHNIATKAPSILSGQPLDQVKLERDKRIRNVLITLNVIMPVILVPFVVSWKEAKNNQAEPSTFVNLGKTICDVGIIILQMLSGFYLVNSLRLVKSYFEESGATKFLNTRVMVLHVGAFGLYLLSLIGVLVVLSLYNFDLLKLTDPILVAGTYFFVYSGMMAQGLLVIVLWQIINLFKATNNQTELQEQAINMGKESEEEFPDIQDAPWDDEAQFQSVVWNKFVRVTASTDESTSKLTLTACSFQQFTRLSACND